ncbi:hypothetical protein [Duganella sp. HH105]|uniref:hypothetical protein n=1 Tax=Duganella sp. HH105 TaxID=1781067 RepID=UPI000877E312|nr:hypothetical protein [Duganella sp. HH105]OEZ62015.1 hypothetical protein DUGA6_16990 [Duganella sp. HH105]
MIECKVHSRVEDMHGKRVLVFLRPRASKTDYLIHPWQTLEISSDATASFQFDETISARILTRDRGGNQTWSAPHVAHPGQLLLAERPDRLSPMLRQAPTGMGVARLTPTQAGVFNQTIPYLSVDCVWQVSGQPVVTMPRLDWGMTCTFEYTPALYFMVATPMISGENFSLQAFTDMVACPLTGGVTVLDIEVCRHQSRWSFSFRSDPDE